MKHRRIIIQKLEHMDSGLTSLNNMVSMSRPVSEFQAKIKQISETLQDVVSYIEREDLSSYELSGK